MKLKSISLLLLICGLLTSAFALAQTTNKQKKTMRIRLDKDKPTVYITHERSGKVKLRDSGASGERVWLRLHNNTRWAIWLQASGASEEYGDASLYYEMMTKDEMIGESIKCHVCSVIPLGANKTLLFSVPREQLDNNSSLRIDFHYDWENDNDSFAEGEPVHYVYFIRAIYQATKYNVDTRKP